MEQKMPWNRIEILFREIHGQTLDVEAGITHHIGIGDQHPIGQNNTKAIPIFVFNTVHAQRLGGVIKLLRRRIKNTLFLIVDGDGVEDDFANGIPIAKFDETYVQFARIVARIGVECHLIRIALNIESTGDFDEIGVGIGIKQSINDWHLFIFGIKVDVGRAGREKPRKKQAKQKKSTFHLCKLYDT